MRHSNLIQFVLAVAIFVPASATGQENVTEGASIDETSVEIQLDQPVHFLGPDGKPVTLAAGRYRVEKGDTSTLTMVAEDGGSQLISAEASGHDEQANAPEALSVETGEDELHILLLQPDGSSLDAAGTYSGIVSRAARRMTATTLSRVQVSSAYQERLRTSVNQLQTAQLSRVFTTTIYVWNRSQFDVNQVWLVRYEDVPGQDVGNKIATLVTNDLSNAIPCAQKTPTFSYNDRISASVPILHDRSKEPNITPYYVFEYIQERLCSNDTHLYWGDINASGGGGYVGAASAKPIPSKPFAPGVIDVEIWNGSSFVNLPGYRLIRETIFLFDASGYPTIHTRYEQALCGPDGKVYLYRKPYPTYFIGHTQYGSGPIPLEVLGSYMGGYYNNIDCGS